MSRLICYVGRGLGAKPQTMLRAGGRHITWNTTDRRVRSVPDEDAADLLRNSPGNFRLAIPASDVTASPARLAEMVAAGEIHHETWHGGDGEQVPVVVVDDTKATAKLVGKAPADPATEPATKAKKGEK